MDPEKKPFERLIFPTKYVIPKSLSRLAIGWVSQCYFSGRFFFSDWKKKLHGTWAHAATLILA